MNARIMPIAIPACAYKNNFNSFDTFMNKCRPFYVWFFIPFFRMCTVIFSVKIRPKTQGFAKIKSNTLSNFKFPSSAKGRFSLYSAVLRYLAQQMQSFELLFGVAIFSVLFTGQSLLRSQKNQGRKIAQ